MAWAGSIGVRTGMSKQEEEGPVELPDAAHEEDVSSADAAKRLELDPDDQRNYTDQPPSDRGTQEGA